ncbi:MAG: hypothetical protein GYA53_08690, partial [Acidobacteria bacterium]|nr:hypothetical protein [Acidobacteriota bacterium]
MILKKTKGHDWREKLGGRIEEIKTDGQARNKPERGNRRAKNKGKNDAGGENSWLEAILERGRPTGPKSAPAARPIASSESQTAAAGVRAGRVARGDEAKPACGPGARPTKLILVTAHRRESFGEGMERICQAIRRVVNRVAEAEVIFPVHLNPNVRSVVLSHLSGIERVH